MQVAVIIFRLGCDCWWMWWTIRIFVEFCSGYENHLTIPRCSYGGLLKLHASFDGCKTDIQLLTGVLRLSCDSKDRRKVRCECHATFWTFFRTNTARYLSQLDYHTAAFRLLWSLRFCHQSDWNARRQGIVLQKLVRLNWTFVST